MFHLNEPKTGRRWTVKRRDEICGVVYDEALARLVGVGPEILKTLHAIADLPRVGNESDDLRYAIEAAQTVLALLDNFDTGKGGEL